MDNEDLLRWLKEKYVFTGEVRVELLRAYTNDVYLVTDQNNKYVLKLYGKDWRNKDDINWEVQLLEHLSKRGMSIPIAIIGKNNERVNMLNDSLVVLYNFAEGNKPKEPFSPELYFQFGQAIGNMHKLSNDFKTNTKRRDIDLKYLIDDPVKIAVHYLPDDDSRIKTLLTIANKVSSKINTQRDSLSWGPVHGDATLDNLHITDKNKIILYDFDSGGFGWRASDLQGWAIGKKEFREKYDAFLEGYKTANQLNEIDIEISPYLTVAWEIWGIEVELNNRIIKQGAIATEEFLHKHIDYLANLLSDIEDQAQTNPLT